jgi:hypothetical protein
MGSGRRAVNGFWTFINVHFPKAGLGFGRKSGFLDLEHNALIFIFS